MVNAFKVRNGSVRFIVFVFVCSLIEKKYVFDISHCFFLFFV